MRLRLPTSSSPRNLKGYRIRSVREAEGREDAKAKGDAAREQPGNIGKNNNLQPKFQWSSGYDFCLTFPVHRRFQVRFLAETYFGDRRYFGPFWIT